MRTMFFSCLTTSINSVEIKSIFNCSIRLASEKLLTRGYPQQAYGRCFHQGTLFHRAIIPSYISSLISDYILQTKCANPSTFVLYSSAQVFSEHLKCFLNLFPCFFIPNICIFSCNSFLPRINSLI